MSSLGVLVETAVAMGLHSTREQGGVARKELGGWSGLRPVPHLAQQCRQQLKPGEVGVFATPEGKQRCWHPHCFACQACSQVLMHLIYFYHDGHLYCGRHHAELLRPRCPACDQVESPKEEGREVCLGPTVGSGRPSPS